MRSVAVFFFVLCAAGAPRIDRQALVSRHNVVITKPDVFTPLQVGNGEFAFTADITGLQTFADAYEEGMPLGTMSQWGWHSFPNPEGYRLGDVLTEYESHGRKVPYADENVPERWTKAVSWLRANPHRIHLGRIGLLLRKRDGGSVALADLTATRQVLDLWSGRLESRFEIDGQAVSVETIGHPERDLVAVRIESELIADRRLGVSIAFPYAAGEWRRADAWNEPARHQTKAIVTRTRADLERTMDATRYFAAVSWPEGATFAEKTPHHFEVYGARRKTLEVVVEFAPGRPDAGPGFEETRAAGANHWRKFWSRGGAVDFSGSTDARAKELERRVVLSQYLTAVNCAGSAPPQETGLVADSWFGKFHLEMHWWHAAHFALWGRQELLEKSLPWYSKILPQARETASRQGYRGARWPKMVGIDGRESPSGIGVFLIWQQPHPIFYAELMYRAKPERANLEKYREVVFESAEFMASYAKEHVLGPPLVPAQESYGKTRSRVTDPTFELAYWYWGLETAQRWRERLGMGREAEWDKVMAGLPRPTVRDGVYAAIAVEPYTIRTDHPSMVAAFGMLPKTPLIDVEVMRRTMKDVVANWDWQSTWGWDYPMLAMTAARLGDGSTAVNALLMDVQKNRYLANGHNFQTAARLPLYLPGNGGLLYAVAMMATEQAFPKQGWVVRWEGLRAAP